MLPPVFSLLFSLTLNAYDVPLYSERFCDRLMSEASSLQDMISLAFGIRVIAVILASSE